MIIREKDSAMDATFLRLALAGAVSGILLLYFDLPWLAGVTVALNGATIVVGVVRLVRL